MAWSGAARQTGSLDRPIAFKVLWKLQSQIPTIESSIAHGSNNDIASSDSLCGQPCASRFANAGTLVRRKASISRREHSKPEGASLCRLFGSLLRYSQARGDVGPMLHIATDSALRKAIELAELPLDKGTSSLHRIDGWKRMQVLERIQVRPCRRINGKDCSPLQEVTHLFWTQHCLESNS